jgi:hypothetical protein
LILMSTRIFLRTVMKIKNQIARLGVIQYQKTIKIVNSMTNISRKRMTMRMGFKILMMMN